MPLTLNLNLAFTPPLFTSHFSLPVTTVVTYCSKVATGKESKTKDPTDATHFPLFTSHCSGGASHY